jgi:uncharacterized repeat protein (TIGR01451 family)
MKLLRVTLPVLLAAIPLVILFALANQTALARGTEMHGLPAITVPPASEVVLPQSSDVISKVLPSGDSLIHGLVYYNGYLYASTRTDQNFSNPARVLEINPDTLDVITSTTLTSLYGGEDIVAANGYLWVILYMEPARLVRVDPGTLGWDIALEFNQPISPTMGAGESLTYAFGYLWVGGRNYLARVNITSPLTPSYKLFDLTALNLNTSNAGLLGSMAHDSQFLWGSYKQHEGPLDAGDFYASTVVKMDPINPSGVYSSTEISTDTPDDSAYTGSSYFVAGEGVPSDIYKFSSDPAVYTAKKAADSASYGLFVNPNEPQYVWGAFTGSPGIIKKFDLNETPVLTITLPSNFNDPSEIAFDELGNVYVTTWQNPAGIVKYAASYFNANLHISMAETPDPVSAGGDSTYTLTITNDGPNVALDVIVTDTLPLQIGSVSSLPGSPDCSILNQELICALGNLGAHSSRQVVISALVDNMASGTITNSASVTSTSPDPVLQNNTAQTVTTIQNPQSAQADLLIGIEAVPNPVVAGDTITYTLTITNNGPNDASGIVVTNTLPAKASFISSSPDAPVCTHSGISTTCNLGQLGVSISQKVVLIARVSDLAVGPITDTAQVISATSDPNQQNNAASRETTVLNPKGVFYRLFLPIIR